MQIGSSAFNTTYLQHYLRSIVHTYVPAVAMPFKLCVKLILATTLLTAAKTTTKIFIIAHTCNVASYVRKCSMH